jgi:hypothetical protein
LGHAAESGHPPRCWLTEKMIEIAMRVYDKKEYQDIAFFHHLILEKIN